MCCTAQTFPFLYYEKYKLFILLKMEYSSDYIWTDQKEGDGAHNAYS